MVADFGRDYFKCLTENPNCTDQYFEFLGLKMLSPYPESLPLNPSPFCFENEDLEFVRACRGRLAKQLQMADD